MMYQNKRNGNVAEVIEINEKFKTVTIEENGKTKTVSTSTLKRWYTPIEVETIDVVVPDDVDVENKTDVVETKTEKKSKTTKKSDKKSVEKKEVKTEEKKSRRISDVIDIDTLTEEGVPTEITDILIENDIDVINTKGMLTLRDIDGKNIARVRVNAKKNSFRLQLKPNNITPDKQINHSFSYVYEGELSDVELFKNLIEQSTI